MRIKNTTKHLSFILVSMVCSSVSFTAWSQSQSMPPAQVKTAPAMKRMMAPTMDISGTVISRNRSKIPAQVEGTLITTAEVGTELQQGDVIANIDPQVYQINVRRAEALLKRLKADLNFREQEVKRFNTLASRDSASKAQLQQELARRDMVVQDIEDAKAQLALANRNLQLTTIKAPFPGHVVTRHAQIGEYLSVGNPVSTLVDTRHLEIVLHAPMQLFSLLKKSSEVNVKVGTDNRRLPIRSVLPVGDQVSRMIEVRVALQSNGEDKRQNNNQDSRWIAGTAVTVSLPREEGSSSVVIPRDALVIKGNETFFYRVSNDGTAEQFQAKVTAVDGQWAAISNPISEGDKIVIRGAERLQPGQPVNVIK